MLPLPALTGLVGKNIPITQKFFSKVSGIIWILSLPLHFHLFNCFPLGKNGFWIALSMWTMKLAEQGAEFGWTTGAMVSGTCTL